jgi:hypothetical protein
LLFRRRLRAPAVEVFQSQIKRELTRLAQLIKPSAKQATFTLVCRKIHSSKQLLEAEALEKKRKAGAEHGISQREKVTQFIEQAIRTNTSSTRAKSAGKQRATLLSAQLEKVPEIASQAPLKPF